MEFESSTEPSLVSKTFKPLDLCQTACQTESSDGTCNPNTAVPSCLSVPATLPNTSLSKPLVPKHSSVNSLDDEIKTLLTRKLVNRILHGRNSDTVQFHREELANELVGWIFEYIPDTYNSVYREQLINLLAIVSKQNLKDAQLHKTEWNRLLHEWLKKNCVNDIIFSRDIYRILAVDGFHGLHAENLKRYLPGILGPIRHEYRLHASGVRAMYEFFDDDLNIESITGTDSAYIVYLALLHFYSTRMQLSDDQVCYQIEQAISWTEGKLQKQSTYYPDLKCVNEDVIHTLANVYVQQFRNEQDWKVVGNELLRYMKVPTDKPKKNNKKKEETICEDPHSPEGSEEIISKSTL